MPFNMFFLSSHIISNLLYLINSRTESSRLPYIRQQTNNFRFSEIICPLILLLTACRQESAARRTRLREDFRHFRRLPFLPDSFSKTFLLYHDFITRKTACQDALQKKRFDTSRKDKRASCVLRNRAS